MTPCAVRPSPVSTWDAIRQHANRREPFNLRLGGNDVTVRVKPNPVWTDACTHSIADATPSQKPCSPGIQTYSGRTLIEGVRTQVRLTIGADFISGYVRDTDHWWFIEPLSKYRPDAAPSQHLVYDSRSVRRSLLMGNDAVRLAPTRDSDERLPERRPREDPDYGYDPVDDPDAPSTGSQPPNMITMQLHLLADREFDGAATSFGRGTLNEHVALVNALDGIYRRTVNVTFQLASSSTDSGSIPCFTATTSSALLDQVKTCFKQLNRSVALGPSDLVHLTSGKTLESRFLGFGHVLGIAFEPGQFGLSTSRLATVIGGVGDLPNLSFEDLLVSAHEIGHNLDGCHKEADSWCDGYFLFFCIGPRNTIMAPIISGATSGFFSAAGFDGAHNNVDRIKFNTTHRIGDTVARTCPN